MMPSKSFSLANLLNGGLAERILAILLERGGYRVTRLGIEELFDEVKYLDREQYLALGLPEQLRTIPDLLVADPGVTWAKLIEVKFRRCFDKKTANQLFVTLTDQRKYWPQSYAVIIVRDPFMPGAKYHQDYIRVIPPDETELLISGPRGIDIPGNDRDSMGLLWRDRVLVLLGRNQSVNLVVKGEPKRREFLEQIRQDLASGMAMVDLDTGAASSRRRLISDILKACGTPADVPKDEDLAVLHDRLTDLPGTILCLRHFDRVAARDYGKDFYSALKYLVMDSRKLVLLLESRAPYTSLLPADNTLTKLQAQLVELKGR